MRYTIYLLILATVSILIEHGFTQQKKNISEGKEVFNNLGCKTCHGADRIGTNLGPPLTSVKKNWNKKSLLEYLKSPQVIVNKNPKLKKLKEKYNMTEMPSFESIQQKQANELVDFLLKGK